MSSFSERLHTAVLKTVRNKGTAVTVTRASDEVYDETDSVASGSSSDISGYAVEILGDPEEYAATELVGSAPATLWFVPETPGSLPTLRSTVPWAGETKTVRAAYPVRPDGTGIAARLVVN